MSIPQFEVSEPLAMKRMDIIAHFFSTETGLAAQVDVDPNADPFEMISLAEQIELTAIVAAAMFTRVQAMLGNKKASPHYEDIKQELMADFLSSFNAHVAYGEESYEAAQLLNLYEEAKLRDKK